jgi:hypothetical protein
MRNQQIDAKDVQEKEVRGNREISSFSVRLRPYRGNEMKKLLLFVLLVASAIALASCEGEKMVWEPAVEQSTFTEIEQILPGATESLAELNEIINRRISSNRYKDEAIEHFTKVNDFVYVVQLYYLPILNARAHIARAYREIQHGMYSEASDDIRKAVDNINKAGLKSTEGTQRAFDVVKEGLMSVEQISDATADASLLRLVNAAKQLNMLIEKIEPVVVMTEEGEHLIDGQM